MITIKDIFIRLEELDKETAVWRRVAALLSTDFISGDTGQAQETVVTDEGVKVSEEIIQQVVDFIYNEKIAPAESYKRRMLEASIDQKLLAALPTLPEDSEEKPKKKKKKTS